MPMAFSRLSSSDMTMLEDMADEDAKLPAIMCTLDASDPATDAPEPVAMNRTRGLLSWAATGDMRKVGGGGGDSDAAPKCVFL
mmetsp:Transcript_42598/g.74656  ORF Transcript_42598/g.74656 Transcript_42598/m.74656 type:complete len:83 (+) Transcript_42598:421-669(+)